ncbi:hypothetical protein AB4Z25_17925 [Rhizobium sp. RAF36]|jgi:hypothetical protein|uniref:hypothetical protein n=1 Tax=Rhizobium sp. RAF36 TaxID=3233055 RepID=UPI003F99FA61
MREQIQNSRASVNGVFKHQVRRLRELLPPMNEAHHNMYIALRPPIMKYYSPNGSPIVGTAETILATARISDIDPVTGTPVYEGGTEIHWDTQETRHRNGKVLFVCDEGLEWEFDELTQLSPDDEPVIFPGI